MTLLDGFLQQPSSIHRPLMMGLSAHYPDHLSCAVDNARRGVRVVLWAADPVATRAEVLRLTRGCWPIGLLVRLE